MHTHYIDTNRVICRLHRTHSTVSDVEFRSPRAHQLWDKWRYVWMLAWERQRRLHDHLMYLQDVERVRQFSWDDWRKRVSCWWREQTVDLRIFY